MSCYQLPWCTFSTKINASQDFSILVLATVSGVGDGRHITPSHKEMKLIRSSG